jgi:hypothetical protein
VLKAELAGEPKAAGNLIDGPEAAVLAKELRPSFSGELLAPGDASYDAARTIWNAMIDRRPGLIARCASTEDVAAAVRLARKHDLLVSVRGWWARCLRQGALRWRADHRPAPDAAGER